MPVRLSVEDEGPAYIPVRGYNVHNRNQCQHRAVLVKSKG
jgi:hypothetical protein